MTMNDILWCYHFSGVVLSAFLSSYTDGRLCRKFLDFLYQNGDFCAFWVALFTVYLKLFYMQNGTFGLPKLKVTATFALAKIEVADCSVRLFVGQVMGGGLTPTNPLLNTPLTGYYQCVLLLVFTVYVCYWWWFSQWWNLDPVVDRSSRSKIGQVESIKKSSTSRFFHWSSRSICWWLIELKFLKKTCILVCRVCEMARWPK